MGNKNKNTAENDCALFIRKNSIIGNVILSFLILINLIVATHLSIEHKEVFVAIYDTLASVLHIGR